MFLASTQHYEFYSAKSLHWHRGRPHLCWGALPHSLCRWRRFRTNWKHCNVSIPSLCFSLSVWDSEIHKRTGKAVRKPKSDEKGRGNIFGQSLQTLEGKHTHTHRNKHIQSYRLVLSLSSPPASSASACPLHLPGFLCGALEFQTLNRLAGHFAPGPPPPAYVGK